MTCTPNILWPKQRECQQSSYVHGKWRDKAAELLQGNGINEVEFSIYSALRETHLSPEKDQHFNLQVGANLFQLKNTLPIFRFHTQKKTCPLRIHGTNGIFTCFEMVGFLWYIDRYKYTIVPWTVGLNPVVCWVISPHL